VLAVSALFLLYFARNDFAKPVGILILATLAFASFVIFRQFVIIRENIRLFREQAIEQSEQRFRSLVQNSFDIVFIFDYWGKILFQSPSVERLLGYKQDELLGKKGLDFVHPDDVEEIKRLTAMIAKDKAMEVMSECRFKHKDGSWRVLEGIATFFVDEVRGINGFLLNSRDITERKLYEKSLRNYARRLKRSNRELQDFAFVASHDLQEPLRKVQAFGDRLKTKYGESLEKEGIDYLERMQSASVRMQTLINDLLSFSRVTTKAKPFKKVDLTKIVKGVLSDLELKIEETNAEIIIENLPEIDADKTQMRQLFQNLIGNALKFQRPDKSPLIKIYTEKNSGNKIDPIHLTFEPEIENGKVPEGFCRIYIEDNGIGFDEKYSDRIFKVFQRLHGNNNYKGSGVGLAICRKIVEHHNGSITAHGVLNKGAKFLITLPVQQQLEEENR
jgi:PAS domain S-box-containing protein